MVLGDSLSPYKNLSQCVFTLSCRFKGSSFDFLFNSLATIQTVLFGPQHVNFQMLYLAFLKYYF